MPDAASRFSAVAGQYDAVRPRPPADLITGITALREVAARRLAQPRTWWWTYRVRLAVR